MAHPAEKGSPIITAQRHLSAVDEFHDVVAVKQRMQPARSRLADQYRSIDPNELPGIELFLVFFSKPHLQVGGYTSGGFCFQLNDAFDAVRYA
jgi:hypothetical protein